ncbi:protein RRP5 homolog isoform X2 [Anopheles funestus]|uniref:protein RRP5 homolog isoform X2 n=1 Tax=Anopheles funestus TaxID=62324 RepID=UPI0020C6FDB9|nr:protein RRP5 homolog isoform X2 [Anopheles funestus]
MVKAEPVERDGTEESTYGLKNRIMKPITSVKNGGATNVVPHRTEELRQEQLSEERIDETGAKQLEATRSCFGFRYFKIGMLVLGCVEEIYEKKIKLILPGRITGLVYWSKISQAYTNRLQNAKSTNCPSLSDLYSCGDLVYVKVLSSRSPTAPRMSLSLRPNDLHSAFHRRQLIPGLVLAATIVEKEDNGYFMDVGVANVRAFLPEENLGQNKDDVGRNLMCSIASASQLALETTIILKAFDPDAPRVLNVEEANLMTIVPGCKLMFTVGEPVKDGLRGMLFEDMVPACVKNTMLTKVTSTPEKYSKFKKIPATLLYFMPGATVAFVSLRPYPKNRIENNPTYRRGMIIEEACVKAVGQNGVWFQFQKKYRAVIDRPELLNLSKSMGNVDLSVIIDTFQIGTTHKVVVISYDKFEDTYIVSNDPSKLHEKIRNLDDIIIGNTYEAHVIKMNEAGAIVKVGFVKGVLYYGNYDHQHPVKVDDIILVRAVGRESDTTMVKFTNNPAFMDEKDNILYDWDQLDETQHQQSFLGLIYKVTLDSVYVSFFNGITGVLDKYVNNDIKVNQLRKNTVEKFTVTEFDTATKCILLALTAANENIQSAVVVNATVKRVHATGVDVRTETGETGTIPSECFSEFGEHNSLYMNLLLKGRTLTVVKTNPGTYSYRLVPYFKKQPMHIESVEEGALLKGSCITVDGVLYVTPLLSNFSQRYEVKTKENYRKVKDGSIINLRVLDVNKSSAKGYELNVSTGLHNVCENGIFSVYEFMSHYLTDVQNLIQRYQEEKMAFASYDLGQLVECVIENIDPTSNTIAVEVCAIDKESNYPAKGIATIIVPRWNASSYKVGQKVPGRVVWIDVERMVVHVCLEQMLIERFVPNGSHRISQNQCWVLFVNNYVQVCCLKSGSPKPLLIVPAKHHYNDFTHGANEGTNSIYVRLIKPIRQMMFAMVPKQYSIYDMFRYQIGATTGSIATKQPMRLKQQLIRCRPAPEMFDDSYMDEEDESENENHGDEENGGNTTAIAEEESFAIETEVSAKRMDNDEEDDYNNDESSAPTSKIRATSKGKQQKKGSSSKNGKIKRKNAEVEESESLPLKKKKKKVSSIEPVKKVKKVKKSILITGKQEKAKKISLKKKKSTLLIDQLDGANDIYLQQLDGAEDSHIIPSDSKIGSKKRKRTTEGLPGASNFWDSTPVYKRAVSDSSDDEAHGTDDEQGETASKKRSTGKERFEAMKQEEERLRRIEDELANPSDDPHTPDQFERLVLAQPNNSMMWIRYMAFHMESAELDKARAVGRKALKSIHFREETDRLNVWMALLNLEIRYETVDSFKEVLQEAVQYNDAFQVYTRAVDILIDCQKHSEVQTLLELLLKKFRKQNNMWFLVADAWYRIGQGGKVKPLLSQALKSLPAREHIPVIVKFAFLHNRNENRDEAHLLFEQILTSYPKRTDIWSQYIDMLVKDNLVVNARQILERAIMQRLPMKNMKTLYTKYVNFEEKHGDRESVRRVKHMAAEYVQAQLNNAGIK